jgi:hypothetical protein
MFKKRLEENRKKQLMEMKKDIVTKDIATKIEEDRAKDMMDRLVRKDDDRNS